MLYPGAIMLRKKRELPMFGFKKKFNNAAEGAKKLQKKDLMEAICAAAVLVAFADGELEDSEVKALQEIVQNQEALQPFGAEVGQAIDRYVGKVKAGKTVGRVQLMNEIKDVKADEDERTTVFAIAVDIANADGEVEPAELDVLKKIGAVLNVRLQDFELAA